MFILQRILSDAILLFTLNFIWAGSALLCTDGWWMWVCRFSSFLDDGHQQQPACTFIWTIIHLHTHIYLAFHKFSLRLYPYSELYWCQQVNSFLLMMSALAFIFVSYHGHETVQPLLKSCLERIYGFNRIFILPTIFLEYLLVSSRLLDLSS